ncbi:MAG TPA: hypothetical protein VKG63_12705 [Steroidobacteraceae bacterium]|nr:hypothetical protein [Steroidobacteraceae bacterium]
MNITLRCALLALGLAWLSGCATSTSAKGAWAGSAPRQAFTKVLIVGVSANFTQRCAFEWSLASQINGGSTQAAVSCDSMTSKDPLTRAGIERVATSDQVDAVLTTAVVSMKLGGQQGNTRDTRATPYYQVTGTGYVTGELGAYGVPVAFVQLETTPSITLLTGDIHVVTKVFETHGATLVYTADTDAKSGDIQSSSSGIETITAQIADRLRRDGVIR